MANAHQVIEVFPWATVEEIAYEIKTALPGLVAAFIDILAEI
jgi:hypothetical protein